MRQLNSSSRDLVYYGVIPDRNYTVQVRGYYDLLGQAGTVTVRIRGIDNHYDYI